MDPGMLGSCRQTASLVVAGTCRRLHGREMVYLEIVGTKTHRAICKHSTVLSRWERAAGCIAWDKMNPDPLG